MTDRNPETRPEGIDGVEALLRASRDVSAELPERAARVHGAVHDAWAASVGRRRRRRHVMMLGLAAAAALAVAIGWSLLRPPTTTPSAVVATVTAAHGTIRLLPSVDRPSVTMLAAGMMLTPDAVIDAGGGRAALTLRGGAAVRLDAGTRLRLIDAATLDLERGAVYLVADGTSLEVRTPFGIARDIGTRFEVRLDGDALQVRVRDGLVDIENQGRRHRAEAGTEVRIAGGRVERSSLPAHGAAWDWTVASAPPFSLDGATLAQFLEWLATESGWHFVWDDDALRAEMIDGELFGPPITNMTAEEALDAVMAITGLRHRRENERVTLERGDA